MAVPKRSCSRTSPPSAAAASAGRQRRDALDDDVEVRRLLSFQQQVADRPSDQVRARHDGERVGEPCRARLGAQPLGELGGSWDFHEPPVLRPHGDSRRGEALLGFGHPLYSPK